MKRREDIGLLLLRVVLGLVFLVHGWAKFQGGIEKTVGFFATLGLPGFLAYVVAVIELVGGLLMILGLGTRVISALFALVMLGAILTAKLSAGFLGGYELDFMLLAASVCLLLAGSTMWACDSLFRRKK
ncbi:DoxX family protein [Brevibacillus massiliensis]|uniref:DoxX family protein n=1 Tax=Brevibacillus massiliensis TaxID=1118054 RepID=UPI0002E1ADD2|nr:DoxX family protein [Brevibacillus massiliensis]